MAQSYDLRIRCIKYLLFASNFMFMIVGLILISIGTGILSLLGDFELFMDWHQFNPAGMIILVGGFIVFVSLFGCFGAMRGNTLYINIYTFLLCMVLIMEILAASGAYVMRGGIKDSIQYNMLHSIKKYNSDVSVSESWDFIQQELECCGVHSIQDWKSEKINGTEITFINSTFNVPQSCCAFANCGIVYHRGCLDHLTYIVSESSFLIGTGALCIALVQIIGVVFGLILAKATRQAKTNIEIRRQQSFLPPYSQFQYQYPEKPTKTHFISDASEA